MRRKKLQQGRRSKMNENTIKELMEIVKNAEKYPVEKARGDNGKYTEI